MRFLQSIMDEVMAFTGHAEPPATSVGEGELVVGVLSSDLQLFWGVLCQKANEIERLEHRHFVEGFHDDEVCRKVEYEEYRYSTLRNIFWGCVREEFGLWGGSLVSLRQDWKVVKVNDTDSLHDFDALIVVGSGPLKH